MKRPLRVRAAHLSGKWNRSPRSLRRQLKRAAKRGATWLTLTEVADGKRPDAVRLPGWSKAHAVDGPGGKRFDLGECAIMARDDTWRIVKWRAYVIGPDLGPGNRIIMVMALLEHVHDGTTVLVSTSHLPSAVEGAWQGRRADQFRLAVDRWRRVNLAWRRAYKPDAEATVADWNLDYFRAWVVAYMADAWPGLDSPRGRLLPERGTHGRRLIDMARVRGMVVGLTVRSPLGASDHRELWLDGVVR